ncbi:LysM peptidoglycan-binding domain-containing protein [Aliikangiella sp. IMCC44359]|uniref:LysM peptidoglycan-binding domain-containing protein n=1 Tax=Aliikangiella sp. IMCC44359 TaxID=3459125 RepID=UPI00403AA3AE
MSIALKYTILPGDTYWGLANKLNQCAGVTWEKIMEVNPGISPKYLSPGQVINIPKASSNEVILHYTILTGNTYYDIAQCLSKTANITVADIESANPQSKAEQLISGQLINIPIVTANHEGQLPVNTPEHIGYYDWTWSPTKATDGATLSVSFSGWADPKTALENSQHLLHKLIGKKYLCLGGGNHNGSWSSSVINAVNDAIHNNQFAQYDGLAFDIEIGDTNLENQFESMFSAAKRQGLSVLVTISHSAPYGIKNASQLMESFFSSESIDMLSPQLYTTGRESKNDYAMSQGVQWQYYKNAKPEIVVSIVNSTMYEDAFKYFSTQKVTLKALHCVGKNIRSVYRVNWLKKPVYSHLITQQF